jgi:hypothetical protein
MQATVVVHGADPFTSRDRDERRTARLRIAPRRGGVAAPDPGIPLDGGDLNLDVSGQAFRYPVAADGTAPLAGPGINIAQLRDAALGVVAELEALTDAVVHDADLAHEAMIDEAQAWWASLSDDERDEYEAAEEELHAAYLAAYLDGHIDPNG